MGKGRFDKYTTLMNTNDEESKHIDDLMKKISRIQKKTEVQVGRIAAMEKEFMTRNECLTKEKTAINNNFLDLKNKMGKFRDGERKKLTELVLNSKSSVERLKDMANLGEKVTFLYKFNLDFENC